MQVQPWTDAQSWDAFVAAQRRSSFQQSWAWGKFKHQVGTDIIRLVVVYGAEIVGAVQALHEPWRFGQSTLSVFSGPIVDAHLPVPQYQEVLGLLLRALVREAKVRGTLFFHLESAIEQCNESLFKQFQVELKLQRAKAFQPLDTQMLDLHQDEAMLLAAMHEKTRYNIRLAEKRGVYVHVATGSGVVAALEQFILLNKQTAARDKFTSHASTYYRRLREHLGDDVLRVYVAMFEKQPIAANIVVHFGDTATYVHGASSNAYRNVMAPHLLQWRQILDARLAWKSWYDFYGIQTPQRSRASKHGATWAGITRFKLGFGGQTVSYLDAYELPIRRGWYRLVKVLQRIF
ncbi:MAG: peptidoglycan bridge formation glycyltransferase FemA/FemB family protein [bacterium]|nr:peptidoglycan bridge formation glycyltransferase FemA/FemB family protein [bacterium]